MVTEGETTFAYGKTLNSVDLIKCINKGKELIGWNEKYPCKHLDNGKLEVWVWQLLCKVLVYKVLISLQLK